MDARVWCWPVWQLIHCGCSCYERLRQNKLWFIKLFFVSQKSITTFLPFSWYFANTLCECVWLVFDAAAGRFKLMHTLSLFLPSTLSHSSHYTRACSLAISMYSTHHRWNLRCLYLTKFAIIPLPQRPNERATGTSKSECGWAEWKKMEQILCDLFSCLQVNSEWEDADV